jgi:hypothetical protein
MSIKTISVTADYTTSVDTGLVSKTFTDVHFVTVGTNESTSYTGFYRFRSTAVSLSGKVITDVKLALKYNNADDAILLKIFQYSGSMLTSTSASALLSGVTDNELASIDILSSDLTATIVPILDLDYYYTTLATALGDGIFMAIERDSSLAAPGIVEISGKDLLGGTNRWREIPTSRDARDSPYLIISYIETEESRPILEMKYTTTDPASDQSTPNNSLGSYVAPNNVYSYSDIGDWINSSQTTIPIASSSDLPSPGLASVGPEIFSFSSVDEDNHNLTNATRGLAPYSFPAGFNSFKVPERVHHLNDLNKLFNTRPSSGLVQYRCVAIHNIDTENNFTIQDAIIGILQNADAPVQIRIGVEFPKFDARSGIAKDGGVITSDTVLVDTDFVEEDGYFDGAAIMFLDPTEYAIAESFAEGVFILDRTITGLVAGRSFIILPAPAQQVANEITAPSTASGRFTGFSETAEAIEINLLEHGSMMQEYDLFYVWIRRTLTANRAADDDIGATLLFRYRDG